MDCRTARQLLEFARPRGHDLDAEDRSALDGHLAHCPECDSLARAERHLDDLIGKAVRDVPVPPGMKDRLLKKLRQQRDEWWRQSMGRGLRYLAAAAAVFLVVFAGFSFWQHQQPRPSAEFAISEVALPSMNPPTTEAAMEWFASKGVPVLAPRDFNSLYLRKYQLARLAGKPVPYLMFIRPASPGVTATVAEVYILTRENFKIDEVTEEVTDHSGDQFKVRVLRPNLGEFVYIIVSTGNLDDLRPPSRESQ